MFDASALLSSEDASLNIAKVAEPSTFLAKRLRLTLAPTRAVDIPCGVAGVVGCELHIDTGELGRLAGASQRVVLAEMDEVFLRGSAGNLEGRPDGAWSHTKFIVAALVWA